MVWWTGSKVIPSPKRKRLHVGWYVLTNVCHGVAVSKQCLGVRGGSKRPLHPSSASEVAIFEHLSALRIYNNTTLTTQESINIGPGSQRQQFAFWCKYEIWDDGEWSRSSRQIIALHLCQQNIKYIILSKSTYTTNSIYLNKNSPRVQ